MAFGDGAIVREVLGAIVGFLRDFASPTGTRGSILLMAGGLVVLGFLFLAFLFRSAIVGDLAPVANARAPIPRVKRPPSVPPRDAPAGTSGSAVSPGKRPPNDAPAGTSGSAVSPGKRPPRPGAEGASDAGPGGPPAGAQPLPRVADFTSGRERGREATDGLDGIFEVLRAQGTEARILESGALRKRVYLYRCASCTAGVARQRGGCDHERGILAGGFEALTGELAKVHETACVAAGADHCEFEVHHAPLRRMLA